MKVDRVILGLTDNNIYSDFWNVFSPVWRLKYNIIPTLIFVGSDEGYNNQNVSDEFGDIIKVNSVPEVVVSEKLDWSVTWALFWAASQFPDDTIMTCGIDQLPLSSWFFEGLSKWNDEQYVIGFGDAYKDYDQYTLGYINNRTEAFFPTSHHVAKGRTYKKVYGIDDDWESEILKVWNFSKDRYSLPENYWGMDECYSSECIDNYRSDIEDIFIVYEGFSEEWNPRRVSRGLDLSIHVDALKNGHYSELHSPRPYINHKEYLDKVIEIIMES